MSKSTNTVTKVDILVYIALIEEFNSALVLFGDNFKVYEFPNLAITCFFRKIFVPTLNTSCVLCIVPAGKMGNTRSATITSALLSKFEPNDVVVIGIAGAVSDDVKPGDVFIPDSVDEYLANAASAGKQWKWTFETSGNHFYTSSRLMNRFQLLSTTDPTSFDVWSRDTCNHFDALFDASARVDFAEAGLEILPKGNLIIGDDRKLASGPAVGKGKDFTDWLKTEVDRKIAALEMESAGVYDAALVRTPAPRVLTIRGISDFADERKQKLENLAKGRFRILGIQNAVSLLLTGIRGGLLQRDDNRSFESPVHAESRVTPEQVRTLIEAAQRISAKAEGEAEIKAANAEIAKAACQQRMPREAMQAMLEAMQAMLRTLGQADVPDEKLTEKMQELSDYTRQAIAAAQAHVTDATEAESAGNALDQGTDRYGRWGSFSVRDAEGWSISQIMRWLKRGSFNMGSPDTEKGHFPNEGPRYEAEIERDFWMFETACPEALWRAVMGADETGSRRGPKLPVTDITWDDAKKFVSALNAGVKGLFFSLPTEEQWEYACRSGTDTPFCFGENATPELICFKADSPAPVASLPPNSWGLRGMHGNVWEWCEDPWRDHYDGRTTDERRAARGGSWADDARAARSASRDGFTPSKPVDNIGFRCVAVFSDSSGVARPAVRIPALGKPIWASEAGRDRYGAYAFLDIGGARQRLRWIPPGSFRMGTPPEERQRYWYEHFDDEIPRHWVVFGHGFWMFDTPCTQQLWEAVLGYNPSFFRHAQHPVESMKFAEVERFIEKTNAKVPGLKLGLPSEAQWEYACRAGTTAATYEGDFTHIGPSEDPYIDPVLDPIAWYGNNSWNGFKLANGKVLADEKIGKWPEKYLHRQPKEPAGTHKVGLKEPNAWGLYDALGNVWEYCADYWDNNGTTTPKYGIPRTEPTGGGRQRTIRGGAWYDWAVFCRSACRLAQNPRAPHNGIGFRCFAP